MHNPNHPPTRLYSKTNTPPFHQGQVSWGGSCMALYNVSSPGGYQLTGLTIPGCDILGSKNGYSLSRPWLFEDFDQLTFYEVDSVEYEKDLALFHSGRYEYKVEDVVFDMEEHNRLLEATREEVKGVRARQKSAQDEMGRYEDELMARWVKEKAEGKVPGDRVEELLSGMNYLSPCLLPLSHVARIVIADDTSIQILRSIKSPPPSTPMCGRS